MVNTFEEIAWKQEKLCDGLIRKYRPIIPLQKAFLLLQQNDLFSGKYSVLVYQWIQERLCCLKQDEITLCDGCLFCSIAKRSPFH